MLKYITIQYIYVGPKGGLFNTIADKALEQAVTCAIKAEAALKLHSKHQYGFPDGSLYREALVDVTTDINSLKDQLISKLPTGYDVKIIEPILKCYKCVGKTYLNAQEKRNAKRNGTFIDVSNIEIVHANYATRCLNVKCPSPVLLYELQNE